MYPPRKLGTEVVTCIPDTTPPSAVLEQRKNPSVLTVTGNPTDGFVIDGYRIRITPQSPAWVALFIDVTNPVNLVSFGMEFSDVSGSEELLSVLWNTNVIGSVDEQVAQPGLREYSFMFPTASVNSTRVLGFRVDSYTNVSSVVTITNITLGFVDLPDTFSLSFTGAYTNGQPVFQLNGPAGYTYRLETSTNLVDWTNVAILANTNGVVPFVDPESTDASQMFFRVVVP